MKSSAAKHNSEHNTYLVNILDRAEVQSYKTTSVLHTNHSVNEKQFLFNYFNFSDNAHNIKQFKFSWHLGM